MSEAPLYTPEKHGPPGSEIRIPRTNADGLENFWFKFICSYRPGPTSAGFVNCQETGSVLVNVGCSLVHVFA